MMNQVHPGQSPYHAHSHPSDLNHLPSDFNPSPTDNMDPYRQQQHQPYYPPPRLPVPSSNQGQPQPPPMGYYGNPQSLPTPGTASRNPSVAMQPQQLSFSSNDDKYKYTLKIEQQPQRARMCGFGDKDRRPLTPPPCVRLVITDLKTGREVDVNDLGDAGSGYVLQVDLWDAEGSREANTVRASSSSPAVSISTAITTSYPPPEQSMMENSARMQFAPNGQPIYGAPMYPQGHRPSMPGAQYPAYYPQAPPGYPPVPYPQNPQSSSSMMFTRNLIGSLAVNASRLNDPEGKSGYWFVLQDLSVRTEGYFRLKMSFVNLCQPEDGAINRGAAPILAWTFSDKFQVYSAKKFPGVIESTPLSKCFASQGIKIPIRKDMKSETKEEEDEGDF